MTQAPAHIAADVLVVGAGGAGMYAALAAAEAGAGRIVLADRNMVGRGGATVMAQMTVAAALGEAEPDSVEDHLEDTLEAGRGLCDPGLAALLCEEGPVRMREMDTWKVGWAREGGRIAQVTAPGHRRRRCCYVDILNTGPAVAATLRRRVARADAIRRVSGLVVTDPVMADGRLAGAVGFDMETGRAVTLAARVTVVATGGLTGLYARSSASANMAGEGHAFALAAGAALIDMEFVQFFPIGHLFPRLVGMDPIMWDPFRYKLGGRLLNGEMEEFLPRYGGSDAGRYTATRDLATHAIWHEVRAGRGSPHGGAYLSFAHVGEAALRVAFGPVIDRLQANGIDLTEAPVEVAPIAHYHMGGIGVDARLATRVPGLFAAGEAVGGANGANRLSGNAITEAFVFGHRAGRNAAADAARMPDAWRSSAARPALDTLAERKEARGEGPSALALSHELRQLMWEQVGPLRDGAGLDGAVERIRRMRREHLPDLAVPVCGAYDTGLADWYTLRAGLEVAEAIAATAAARRESRGAHQREDFSESDAQLAMSQTVTRAGGVLAPAFPAAA